MDRPLTAVELEAALDELLSASSSYRSVARLAAGLEPLARAQQALALHWAGVAAQTYDEIGYQVVSLAPKAFALLDAAGFEAWVLAGLDTYDRVGLRAAMEQLRHLDAFCAARSGTPVARLVDVEARLTRFVHGLSGRALGVRAGAAAWTDTETVYLPEVLALRADAEGNRALYKAMVAMLWAQTRYGTFSTNLEAALAHWPDRTRALAWLAIVEAVRLEARIGMDLPGLGAEIARQRAPWPEMLTPLLECLTGPAATVADSLACLPVLMASQIPPPTIPTACALEPASAQRVRAERIARETQVLRNALGALRNKAAKGRKTTPGVSADLDAERQDMAFRIDGEVIALPPEAQAAAQSLVQDLGELPHEALSPAGPGQWQPTDRTGAPELVTEREGEWRYDEWDYHRQAYRRGWCHVYPLDVRPGDGDYVSQVRARYAPLIHQIRRRFEAMRGEDRILARQPDGEEIDLDALVDAKCDRRSGAEPSPRLFCRRVRNQRSLAAMFMVDMSGSTKGWVNDAERKALVMLCEALETLGDAYAIYGFSGWTRTRCDIYRIKAFEDRYDDTVRARIAGIEAKDYTRMGVAIRHLSHLLAERPARHKLLVTLSDGRPDDFGDEYRSQYGIEDTRRALLEAMRSGIRPFCITLDREAREYLPHLYGAARYTVIDDVARLPYKVADIYRRLTR
jgi:nitric oxide reductase NorD protein